MQRKAVITDTNNVLHRRIVLTYYMCVTTFSTAKLPLCTWLY